MAKKSTEEKIGFALVGIHPYDFFSKESSYHFDISLDVHYHLSFSIGWDKEQEVLKIFMNLLASFEPEVNRENAMAGISILYDFKLSKVPENILNSSGKVELEKDLRVSLLSVATSTGRGIFFERTKGTSLQSKFFPLLDPNSLP